MSDLVPRSSLAEELDPRHWYSTNLVGIPASTLASTEFNARPAQLRLAATRETHGNLFSHLEHAENLEAAREAFASYMQLAFSLEKPSGRGSDPASGAEERAYRSSYVKLLSGWGFESSSAAGAVLKGWVESRFGISPTFHRSPLGVFPSRAWATYIEEKLGTRYHNNCIYMQLDLLFEYCQLALSRFAPLSLREAPSLPCSCAPPLPEPVLVASAEPMFAPSVRARPRVRQLLLYRGTEAEELPNLRRGARGATFVARLNNLVSFSVTPERADEFGGRVLEVWVPSTKVLFFPGLLKNRVLNGEGEVLVVGGDFQVRLRAD